MQRTTDQHAWKRGRADKMTRSKQTLHWWRSQTYIGVYLSQIINMCQGAVLVSRRSACRRSWNFVIWFHLLLEPKTQVQRDLVEHTTAQKQQIHDTKQDCGTRKTGGSVLLLFDWPQDSRGCAHIQNRSQICTHISRSFGDDGQLCRLVHTTP